jgi:hypothetical protein
MLASIFFSHTHYVVYLLWNLCVPLKKFGVKRCRSLKKVKDHIRSLLTFNKMANHWLLFKWNIMDIFDDVNTTCFLAKWNWTDWPTPSQVFPSTQPSKFNAKFSIKILRWTVESSGDPIHLFSLIVENKFTENNENKNLIRFILKHNMTDVSFSTILTIIIFCIFVLCCLFNETSTIFFKSYHVKICHVTSYWALFGFFRSLSILISLVIMYHQTKPTSKSTSS